MSENPAEKALIDYLVEQWSLDRPAAIERIRIGVPCNWFSEAEPELSALVVACKNTLGRDGRKASRA